MIRVVEDIVHKNQGKTVEDVPVIILKKTLHDQPIQMKTKLKYGDVDVVVATIPRDDCYSRLENWRPMLKDPEGRKIRIIYDEDTILQVELFLTKDDNPEWDSVPIDFPGTGWVPFYFAMRPKDD